MDSPHGSNSVGKKSSPPFRGRGFRRGNRRGNHQNRGSHQETRVTRSSSEGRQLRSNSGDPTGSPVRGNKRKRSQRGKHRNQGGENPKPKPPDPTLSRPIAKGCPSFMKGKCFKEQQGEVCRLLHLVQPKKLTRCKFFITQQCKNGDKCTYSHDVPCKYYHLYNNCGEGPRCRFSHAPLTHVGRSIFIKELGLDLPPTTMHHDFNRPHQKSGGTPLNPLSLNTNIPEYLLEPLPGDRPIEAEVQAGNQKESRSFSIAGFYKDTLGPEEETRAASTGLAKEGESAPVTNNPGISQVISPTDIVNGVSEKEIDWHLPSCDSSSINYADIRSQVLIGYTLLDPRLSAVPRPKPAKCIQELGEIFPDILKTAVSVEKPDLDVPLECV